MLPSVYPILDTATLARRRINPLEFAGALLAGGAALIQLRHKGPFGPAEYSLAWELAAVCRAAHARFLINDRADIAKLLGAEVGVHIGQDDLSPHDARSVVGDDAWVGLSTHNASQLTAGNDEPVTYLAIGPVFSTTSKDKADPSLGLESLGALRALTAKPLVAIGGISLEAGRAVFAAGIDSVAVISDLVPEPWCARSTSERMEQWRNCKQQTN